MRLMSHSYKTRRSAVTNCLCHKPGLWSWCLNCWMLIVAAPIKQGLICEISGAGVGLWGGRLRRSLTTPAALLEGIYRQSHDCSSGVKLWRLQRQIEPCHQDSQCGHQKKPHVGLFVGWWCQTATERWMTIKENASGGSWPVHSVDTHACQQEPNVDLRACVNRLLLFVENLSC